ncbi:MAG TPA: hypothetical protein VK957_06085, partial [Lunatimonas sp.]|nr:hypothetical protein [Lunatimonas sp.]
KSPSSDSDLRSPCHSDSGLPTPTPVSRLPSSVFSLRSSYSVLPSPPRNIIWKYISQYQV